MVVTLNIDCMCNKQKYQTGNLRMCIMCNTLCIHILCYTMHVAMTTRSNIASLTGKVASEELKKTS